MPEGSTAGLVAILVLLLAVTAAEGDEAAPVVKTRKGSVRGRYQRSSNGRQLLAFYNLPYAKPPVGPLRFRDPQPVDEWNNVRDATAPGNVCTQISPYDAERGSEDCLYLNVFTPQLISTVLLPVMFWIHGGGWALDGGKLYGPDYLLNHDVVLVTINYRLGSLGFLSTGDEASPGNYGLKDQVAALKWVKENIEAFGGDPNSVTLFGESAGGASTHYHLISPLSRGLFHKAISQSGSALVPWALTTGHDALEKAHELAELAGCSTVSSVVLIDCLRGIEAHQLITMDTSLKGAAVGAISQFKPVIENEGNSSFLPKNPLFLQPAPVPWMIGVTEDEGGFISAGTYANKTILHDTEKNIKMSLQLLLSADTSPTITDQIYKFYFPPGGVFIRGLTDLLTDTTFFLGIDEAVRVQGSSCSIFYYLFSYKGSHSFADNYGQSDFNFGPCHTDDLLYLFPKPPYLLTEYNLSEADRQFAHILTTLWTNFARTGNPTPNDQPLHWPKVASDDKLEYLQIGQTLESKKGLFQDRVEFWNSLGFEEILEEQSTIEILPSI